MHPSRGVWFAPKQGRKCLTQRCWDSGGSGEATGRGHCRFAVLRSFSSQPFPPFLRFGRSTQAAFDPSSHVLMWDGRASGAGLRTAICILLARWTTRSFIPNSERATITGSACGGRKATHFQSTTDATRRRRRRRTVCPSLLLLRTLPYIFRSTLPISRPVRPSFCQSRGDCAPTPIPYIRVVPAQAASRRIQEEVSAVTHTYPKVKDRSRSLSKSTRRMRSVKVHVGNKFRILRDRKKTVASLCSFTIKHFFPPRHSSG